MWRAARWLAVGVTGAVGIVLGLTAAALGTEHGRDVVVAAAVSAANGALDGVVSVDSTGGSVYDGLFAYGVRVTGHDGRPLLAIERVQLQYRVGDLLSRRIVLGQLYLRGATLFLERRAGERFNYEDVLKLGQGGGGRPGPLIAFRNARVEGLTVTIRTPAGDEASRLVTRAVAVRHARLPYVRVSSPFPGEEAIRLEIAELRAVASDPALDVHDASGVVEIRGDTVRLDLERGRLPGTVTTMRGRMWGWDRGPLVDLRFTADTFASADVAPLFDWLPPGLTGAGALEVVSRSDAVVQVRAENLRLATANGGSVRGVFGMTVGPGEDWAVQRVDLETRDFDLAYLRGMLDTVPMDGRLTGRTRADGPRRAVQVDLDWLFHDRRADSAATTLRGRGEIGFGVPGDIVFRQLALSYANVALATVHAISPAVALGGTLEGAGTLDGPWQDATFSGLLRHRQDTLPVSVARGVVRLDTRRDTVGVWASLQLDSLQFAGVRPSYPQVPFAGAMAGDVELAGYLDALSLRATLAGPRGRLEGGGTFVLLAPHLAARDLDVAFRDLTLEALEREIRGTALNGRVRGTVDVDTLRPPILDVALDLGRSRVGGSPIDSMRADVRVVDSLLRFDTLRVWTSGLRLEGRGGLGLAAPRTDSLALALDADSLGALAPLLLQFAGRDTAALATDTLTGAVRGRLTLFGSLDRLAADWWLEGRRLAWNEWTAFGARTGGRWAPDRVAVLAGQLEADSLLVGERRYGHPIAALIGRPDSLHWIAQSRLGPEATGRAGGVAAWSDAGMVRFDSLVLRTADDVWTLAQPSTVTVTDSAIGLDDFTLGTADGGSRVRLGGVIPRAGAGAFEGSIEGLPLPTLWALAQADPSTTAGEVSGTFRLGGTARNPAFEGSFSLREARFSEYRAPLMDGEVTYRDRHLTATLTTWRAGTRIVTVDVDLPLDLGFRGVERRRLPGPLTVRARADGVDLSLLSAVTPLVRQTEGRMWADLGITGTWERPALAGSIEIRDGAATLPSLGVRHQALNGRLSLRGDTIRVDTLSVTSGQGTMWVTGFVRLEELTRPLLALGIRAEDFRAMDVPGFLTLTTSGQVQLQGPVFNAVLTGTGTLPRGVVHFADIVEKEIINLSDTVLGLDSAAAEAIRRGDLGPDFENRFLDSLRIENLVLTMGNDVRLRSSEADIFLTGQVTAQKVRDQYRLDGTLQTPRGTYELYLGPTIRKAFTVTRGEVRYFGTPDLNAALDIDARHQLRGQRGEYVIVFVHVGGTILAPELTLSTDVQPPLAEAEIISYLVLGAPNAQATSGDVGRYGLQQSITTLTGQITGSLGSQLLDDLGVPLDFLIVRPQFGARGVEATEIAVGRQIGDRWFVTLNPWICRRQSFTLQNLGGSLEFQITRHWSVVASADPVRTCSVSGAAGLGTQLQLGLDVLWERRF